MSVLASCLVGTGGAPALAWGSFHGAYGGAAFRGPAGGAAVRGPGGNWAARGPGGNYASGHSYGYHGGAYHGAYYGGGYHGVLCAERFTAVAAGAAGVAVGAAATARPPRHEATTIPITTRRPISSNEHGRRCTARRLPSRVTSTRDQRGVGSNRGSRQPQAVQRQAGV